VIKLVFVRHGQSIWNLENKFTGWTNVELSKKGVEEAIVAGKMLKNSKINFKVGFTSYLLRAQQTFDLINSQLLKPIKIIEDWRLNERHYGALQGFNKAKTAEKYGSEQVQLWRRSADVRPPLLKIDDERNPKFDVLYKDVKDELPLGESLCDTEKRVVKFFEDVFKSNIKDGENSLIVAHGNSIRALIKHLDNVSNEEIVSLEIPTGKPIVYELDSNFKPIKHYYL